MQAKGKWFEEFEVGHKFPGMRITVTEYHIAAYAGLINDFHPLHMDEEFAKKGPFGKRIAHGMLTASFAIPAITPLVEGTAIAHGGDIFRYPAPVFIGDTISTEVEVTKTERKEKYGIVTFKISTKNQRGETVLDGETVGMIRFKPEEAEAT